MGRQTAIPLKLVFMVALLFATPLFAQFSFPAMGGRSAAMGGSAITLGDEESAMHNIAALAQVDNFAVAASFRQGFMEEGMGCASFGGVVPVGFGAGALTFLHFGNADYNEQGVNLLYGIPIGQRIAMGVGFHYLHSGTSDPYYEPLNRMTFSLALRYAPTKAFSVGFRAFNPSAVVSDADASPRLPALLNLGLSYRLTEQLLAVAEVEKDLQHLATLRFGVEYLFHEVYAFRVGFNTQPAVYTFGFGLCKEHFGADIAAEFHSVLGLTPQLSLNYRF